MIGLLCRRFALILAVFAVLPAAPALAVANIRDSQQGLPDLDARTGALLPTAAQSQLVSSLGAHATWNRFGTPQSLIHYGGFPPRGARTRPRPPATGLSSDPVAAATSFVSNNKALFRLSDQGVANLQLVNDSPLAGSAGHAVMFRQTFGALAGTQDGLIPVGVVGGKIAYVSSSAAGDGNAPGAATLSAAQAWVLAAQNV